MRKFGCAVLGTIVSVLSLAAQQPPAPRRRRGSRSGRFRRSTARCRPRSRGRRAWPGSTKSYTPAQIDDLSNPPDWFPDEHPPAPSIVQKGHGGALACGACHLMSGEGHPESAGMTGFTAELHRAADGRFQERRAERTPPHERDRQGDVGRGDRAGRPNGSPSSSRWRGRR